MSDIDLKALRKTCDACVASDRLMPVANAWQVLAVFDRLESAERRAEEAEKECAEQAILVGVGCDQALALLGRLTEAEKERDALRKDAERYRWLCGADVPPHSTRWPRWRLEYWGGFHAGWNPVMGIELDQAVDAAMAQEGGK